MAVVSKPSTRVRHQKKVVDKLPARGDHQAAKVQHRALQRWSVIERLEWLLKFVQRSESEFNSEQLEQLIDECLNFCSASQETGDLGPLTIAFRKVSEDYLKKLAKEVRDGIDQVQGKMWMVPMSDPLGEHGYVFRCLGPGYRVSYYVNGLHQAFVLAAMDVLAAEGRRIARCERKPCAKLFVRRKRGKYCSATCRERVKLERFIEGKGGAEGYSAYRHEKYQQRLREAGRKPKLKVPRQHRRKEQKQ
jgi:hypothetical protein